MPVGSIDRSGRYPYQVTVGFGRIFANCVISIGCSTHFIGRFSQAARGTLISVSAISSPFGAGWALAGWQELVENADGSVLLIDGNGTTVVFSNPQDGVYESPPGDFSTLKRLPGGTFSRTLKDQTEFLFNDENKLALVRDRNGNETRHEYDTAGRLIKIVDPVGLETVFTYTEIPGVGDRITSITDPAGRTTQLEHDDRGNLTRITDPDGSARTFEYDDQHHLTAEIDKLGNREEAFYDPVSGRATGALRKDGSFVSVDPVATRGLHPRQFGLGGLIDAPFAVNRGDPIASYADANGNMTTTTLDTLGQAASSFDAIGSLGATVRDEDHLVVARTDGEGNATFFEYDERGNLTRVLDDLAGGVVRWVNLAGGDWLNPDNWNTGVVPGPSDNVFIGLDGGTYQVTLSTNVTIRSLTVGGSVGTQLLALTGSTVIAPAGVHIRASAIVNLRSSTINGDLLNDGTLLARATSAINGALSNGVDATLRVEGLAAIAHATLTVANGFTNEGLIELFGDVSFRSATLNVSAGTLVNAVGGSIDALAGGGGPRALNAQLDNQGTLTVSQVLTIGKASAAHTNSGTISVTGGNLTLNQSGTSPSFTSTGGITLAAGRTLTINGGTLNHDAGSIGGEGALALSGVAVNLGVDFANDVGALSFTNSTVNGPGILTNPVGKTMTVAGTTINAELANLGTLRARATSAINGALSNGVDATLRVEGLAAIAHATLTVANGFTNEGAIELFGDVSFRSATLNVSSGTLVNAVGGSIDALAGSGGPRALNAQLDNRGTLTVSQVLTMGKASAAHTNSGTISVTGGNLTLNQSGTSPSFTNTGGITLAAGRTLTISGGTLNHDAGSIGGEGALALSGVAVNLGVDFTNDVGALTFTNSTVNGPGILTNPVGKSITLSGTTVNAELVNDGTLRARATSAINGALSNGVAATLRVEGLAAIAHATLTVANGFTNEGAIELFGDVSFRSATLNVSSGTLVNAVGGSIDVLAGGGGPRTLNAQIDNQGTLTVSRVVTMGKASAAHTNSGTISVAGGNLTVSPATSLTNTGTIEIAATRVFSLSGAYTQGSTGALSVDIAGPAAGQFGRVTVSGAASLAGTLNIDMLSGTTVIAGDAYAVVTYGSRAGTFDPITVSGLDPGFVLDPSYGASALTLTAVAVVAASASTESVFVAYLTQFADRLDQSTARARLSLAPRSTSLTAAALVTSVNTVEEYDADVALFYYVLPASNWGTQTDLSWVIGEASARWNGSFVVAEPDGADVVGGVESLFRISAGSRTLSMVANASTDVELFDRVARLAEELAPTPMVAPHPATTPASSTALDGSTPTLGPTSISIAAVGTIQLGVEFTYDPVFSQITSVTDELGHQTLIEIDPANGNALSSTRVVGLPDTESTETDDIVTLFSYTPQGLIDTRTDPLGRVTDFDYDAFGRVTTITFAQGTTDEASKQFEYDQAGNRTAIIDENGNRTEFEYDVMNRLVRLIQPDPDGAGPLSSPVHTFAYDANGNRISKTDPRGQVTLSEYDTLDRLIKSIDADGQETLFAYDPVGNLISTVDPLGNETRATYDARNRLVDLVDPDDGSTQYAYDANDDVTAMTDALGNRTEFTYDARRRLIRETDPLSNAIVYEYDAVDNLAGKTDRNGRRIRFEYDDLDRLITETWVNPDDSTANVIQYTYADAGNLLAAADDLSSLTFTYDGRNRVKTEGSAGTLGAASVVLDYAYDGAGNVLSVVDTIGGQEGATTSYVYDADDRLTGLTQAGPATAEKRVDLAYDELGLFTLIERFSDLAGSQPVVASGYTYDALNRLASLSHSNPASVVVSSFDMVYDTAGRVTGIADVDGLTGYTYDDRDQLIGADHADAANPDEAYSYDANGNRVSSSLPGADYVTGSGNQLLSDGTFDYGYDGEGNLISRTDIVTGDVREFEWDHRNRLSAVIDKDNLGAELQRVEFAYDAVDRRTSKTAKDTAGEVTTYFVYDRRNVIVDFLDDDGAAGPNGPALDQRYLHGPGVDQVLAQEDAFGNVVWHLADHLGTIRDLVDGGGAVVNHVTYDSYGNVTSDRPGGADPLPGHRAGARRRNRSLLLPGTLLRCQYWEIPE